jgi:cytidine deaminase
VNHEPSGPIDWPALRRAATDAAANAHAPFSGLHVGAAGITDTGQIITGCNVESASYGLTLCAECGLVSSLHLSGAGKLVAVSAVDGSGNTLTPCGRCRQLLYENGHPDLLVDHDPQPLPIGALLPEPFGADDLPAEGGS